MSRYADIKFVRTLLKHHICTSNITPDNCYKLWHLLYPVYWINGNNRQYTILLRMFATRKVAHHKRGKHFWKPRNWQGSGGQKGSKVRRPTLEWWGAFKKWRSTAAEDNTCKDSPGRQKKETKDDSSLETGRLPRVSTAACKWGKTSQLPWLTSENSLSFSHAFILLKYNKDTLTYCGHTQRFSELNTPDDSAIIFTFATWRFSSFEA